MTASQLDGNFVEIKTESSTFTPGEAMNVNLAAAYHNEVNGQILAVTVAQYDEVGRLIASETPDAIITQKYTYSKFTVTPAANAHTIKIMVWEDFDNMRVMKECTVFSKK